MKRFFYSLSVCVLMLASFAGKAQTLDCFIIDNPSNSSVDIYVVANGGDFLEPTSGNYYWADMVVTLSIPSAGSDLGDPDPVNLPANFSLFGGSFTGNSFAGNPLEKQPAGVTGPTFSNPGGTINYYSYAFTGATDNFENNYEPITSNPTGQQFEFLENVPVIVARIPKNGNAFADIDILPMVDGSTPSYIVNENASYYQEVTNVNVTGNVSKEDIIHLNNKLNELPITPDPLKWLGGSDASEEPNLTDVARNLTIYSGPAVKTMIGGVDNIDFIDETSIEINPNGGLQTTTINKANAADADSIHIKADATGYGQYIGPAFAGSIEQYAGTDEGWRNMSFPISESDVSANNLDLGGASANFNTASTSHHATSATPDFCGSFGGWINTVNVYNFLGAGGLADDPVGDHEWYGASGSDLGGNKGYSIFMGGSNFTTNGIVSVEGTFQDGPGVGDYLYSNEAPHLGNATGASQQNYDWNLGSCPSLEEVTADRQANWDGWVLVANPFPCGLDVTAFRATNGLAENSIRVWNRNKTYGIVGGGGAGTALPDYSYEAMADGEVIPPMQAFFVKVGTAPSTKSISFLDAHRSFSDKAFLKTEPEAVFITAMNTADSVINHAVLAFNPAATDHYDELYDAYVLSQPGATRPQVGFHNEYAYVYGGTSHQVISPLFVNTVNTNVSQGAYPMRFWSRSSGSFSFSLDQTRLNSFWKIYIEDTKLAPGVFTDITNTTYSFSYLTSDSPTRFILHFANTALGLDDLATSTWDVNAWFNSSEQLVIGLQGKTLPSAASVNVMSISGKVLYQSSKEDTRNEVIIDNNFATGVYFVSIEGENGETRLIKVLKSN